MAKLRAIKEEEQEARSLPTELQDEADPQERVQEYIDTITMPTPTLQPEGQQTYDQRDITYLSNVDMSQDVDISRPLAPPPPVLNNPTNNLLPLPLSTVEGQQVTSVSIVLSSSDLPTSSTTTVVTVTQPRMSVRLVNTTNVGPPMVSMVNSSTTTPYSGMLQYNDRLTSFCLKAALLPNVQTLSSLPWLDTYRGVPTADRHQVTRSATLEPVSRSFETLPVVTSEIGSTILPDEKLTQGKQAPVSSFQQGSLPDGMDSLAQVLSQQIAINRLPPPEPGIFTGNSLEYQAWKQSFDLLVNQSPIAPVEKLHYLRRYVSGEAKECIVGNSFRVF